MNELIKKIFNRPDTNKKPGANEQEILAFEINAGISLPLGYKDWLALSDGGEIFNPGVELYGVAEKKFPKLLVRCGDDVEVPNTLVVIGRTAFGDAICFENGSEKIIQWSHETNEEYLTWDSFANYLEDAEEMYGDES
jgi:hypothetical protein